MQIKSGRKNASAFDQEIPASISDPGDGTDESYQLEIAAMQNDENINLDDALDDDNESPTSHTLVDAAENTGPVEIRDTQELEGEEQESEEQESKDRVGSLSPLYKEI